MLGLCKLVKTNRAMIGDNLLFYDSMHRRLRNVYSLRCFIVNRVGKET